MDPSQRRLLLVHAHPDDETLTTGGTIARYAAEGAQVTVVTCTLGEEGEIIPAALQQLGAWAGDQLGGYRAGELERACTALGVRRHHYLGGIGRWRDSGMAASSEVPDSSTRHGCLDGRPAPDRPLGRTSGPPSLGRVEQPAGTPAAEHPRAFVRGALDEQAGQLRALLDELRPQVVVGYDSYGGYGHPDHIRAHQVTMAAVRGADSVRRVFHTVAPEGAVRRGLAALRAASGVPFRVPDDGELPTVADARVHTEVALGAHGAARLAALRAHATQVSVSDGPPVCWALSNGIALPALDAEYFELVSGPPDGSASDLFGGLD